MKLQQLLTFVSMAVTIAVTSGHIGGDMSIQDIKPSVYCGRRLADVLAALCSYKEAKRGGSAGYYMSNAIPAYYDVQEEMNWPWLAPHKARAVSLPSRGKRYSGVVSECCDKACTVDELMSYC